MSPSRPARVAARAGLVLLAPIGLSHLNRGFAFCCPSYPCRNQCLKTVEMGATLRRLREAPRKPAGRVHEVPPKRYVLRFCIGANRVG